METLLYAGLSNAVFATLLAVLVACLARPLARRPAVLHGLWLLVLLKLVMPPLYLLPIRLPETRATVGDNQAGSLLVIEPCDGNPTCARARIEARPSASSLWTGIEVDWSRLLATIWLAGSVVSIVVAARRIIRFQRLLNDAEPASEEIQEWVGELAIYLGLRRPPSVWWTEGRLSPMLWALGRRPRLIVPHTLWKSLDDRQRSTLVVHELAHLRRGDHHVRLLELIVTTLYWWHPVAWWARRALRDVEEQCCDAWVVWTFPDAARSYAETLLETLDFLNQSDHPEPLLASGFGKVHHLRRRLTMIMSGSTPRLVSVWGALGSLALAALLLPVSPTWAQKPAGDEKRAVVIESVVVGEPHSEVAVVTADDGSSIAIVEDVTDHGKPKAEVNVTVKTDDQPALFLSGPLEQAISALKDHMKALEKKDRMSESDKKLHAALGRAVKEITRISREAKVQEPKSGKETTKAESKRIIIRKLDLDSGQVIAIPHGSDARSAEVGKLVAEARQKAEAARQLARANVRYRVLTKGLDAEQEEAVKEKQAQFKKAVAEMEKVRRAVDELTKDLMKKREELSRAAGELSRLRRIEARVVEVPDPEKKPAATDAASASRSASTSRSTRGPALLVTPKMIDSDRKRLADLEKKLDKLLEEVASLKKARAK